MRTRTMRVNLAIMPLLVLAGCLAGCETDRDPVQVDLTAAARAYRQMVDRRPSREQMEAVIASLPAEQLTDLGVMYEREGRLEEAARAYQQAIWREPRYARAYVNLGNVLRKQGKTEEALFRYRQAMSADPASFEAANNFADLCAEEGSCVEEAIERLEPRVEMAGALRPYGLDTLGWLYHLKGDEEKAAATLERALAEAGEGDPGLCGSVHKHLAEVYRTAGRAEEAGEHEEAARRLQGK
jgi:tetratricopeptide (TPR) repeat protein